MCRCLTTIEFIQDQMKHLYNVVTGTNHFLIDTVRYLNCFKTFFECHDHPGSIPIDDEDDEDYSEGSGSQPRTRSTTTSTTTTTTTTTTSTSTTTTRAPSTAHKTRHRVPMITDDEDLLEEGSGNFQELGSGDTDRTQVMPSNSLSPSEIEKIRKSFSEEYGVDILRLDTSCVSRFVEAPKIKHATMQ